MGNSKSKNLNNDEKDNDGFVPKRYDIEIQEEKHVYIIKYYGPKETAKPENLAPLYLTSFIEQAGD